MPREILSIGYKHMQKSSKGVQSLKTVNATETIYSVYSLGHKWKEKWQYSQEVMDWTKAK